MSPKVTRTSVPLYDRGRNLVCFCTPEQVAKFADQPDTQTVRARDGRILRIILCDPGPAQPGASDSNSSLPVGQRYSYQEQLADTIYRPWTLKASRALLPALLLAALADCGAQLIPVEDEE